MPHRRRATIRWSGAICREPGNFLGWPSIARLADGELLVVFSGNREEHTCPYGRVELIRSRDGGETWSAPEVITDTPVDDRDPAIVPLRSGALLLTWMARVFTPEQLRSMREGGRYPDTVVRSWERHWEKVPAAEKRRWAGEQTWILTWTRRSSDGGRTWSEPVHCPAASPHGPIELRDGRLLFVGEHRLDHRTLVAAESGDEGRSWGRLAFIPVPERDAPAAWAPFHEPHCVELPGGRIVCLWRYQTYHPPLRPAGEWHLHQCESDDGGRSWSEPRPTRVWGYPPHLLRLSDGALLATYGYRREPFGERACLSHDDGRTWDVEHEIVLREDGLESDLGYPATVELAPGELLTVYYQRPSPDETHAILATRWSLG